MHHKASCRNTLSLHVCDNTSSAVVQQHKRRRCSPWHLCLLDTNGQYWNLQ